MKLIRNLIICTIMVSGLSLGLALPAIASDELKFSETKALAEQGDASEQYWLGNLYKYGWGTPRDEEKALYWYRESAKQNNSEGQLKVGMAYYDGAGVTQDYERARYWFLKSAEQNNKFSLLYLGNMYKHGEGVEENYSIAEEWYLKACDNGGGDVGCQEYGDIKRLRD